MKKLLAFILFLAFAVESFHYNIIVVNFYLNQQSIASRYCINKSKPLLHCNGQCQLAKKLKQEEKKDRQNPDRKPDNKNEVISSRSFFATLSFTAPDRSTEYYQLPEPRTVDRSLPVFHPPCS
ncbi:MAG TPA: hypothetical protein VFS36_10190 [Chitinophagaceae bacterium]|nr:hypothetical protein [Chitinophagaceae bacterium]